MKSNGNQFALNSHKTKRRTFPKAPLIQRRSLERQADRSAGAYLRGETGIGRNLSMAEPSVPIESASRAESLPTTLQTSLEQAFETDLSAIRIHRDSAANSAAGMLNARAFASGAHIYLGANQFHPGSSDGKRLLAHEVAHSIQQSRRSSQSSEYPHKVTEVRGTGTPQCWSIPLSSTTDLPDIETILRHYVDNPQPKPGPNSAKLLNRLLINHREAVRNKNVPEFWKERGNHVIGGTEDPIFKLSSASRKASPLDDSQFASALYDGLKRAGEFIAAGKLLNQFPDIKTTFFSADAYNEMVELNLSNVRPLKNLIYKRWYESAWFGRANPRFMMDLTLAFFLRPSARLTQQAIRGSLKLTKANAEIELKRRHKFAIKDNEIYYMTVLIASQIEEFRYATLLSASNAALNSPGGNPDNRARLKIELLKFVRQKLVESHKQKGERVIKLVGSKGLSHSFGASEPAFETDIFLVTDVIQAFDDAAAFASNFWAGGSKIRDIANHVDFKKLALNGTKVIKTLKKYVPDLYVAVNNFVDGILQRDDKNSLPEPNQFDEQRKNLMKGFQKGVFDAQNKVTTLGTRKTERNFADRFFDALPENKKDKRAFSFNIKKAQSIIPADSQAIVAWGFLIAQELYEKAREYNLGKDKQMVSSQRGFEPNAPAADIREIFRLRFAEKLQNVAQSVGWTRWTTLAEDVIHGREISSEAIYFRSDWVADEISHAGLVRADFSNRKGETIGGIEPLGKGDLFDFLMAEDYRNTSRHINDQLGKRQGKYSLADEPLLNDAVGEARKDVRPQRYVIEQYDWIRPYEVKDGQLKNNNLVPSYILIGQHPLTRKLVRKANATAPQKVFWLANQTKDKSKGKFVCVLWLIPSPINLIHRIQQIDAVNDVLASRMQTILDPKNQSEIAKLPELKKAIAEVGGKISGGSGFRADIAAENQKGATIESITREQLKALKWDVWWKVLELAKWSLFYFRDKGLNKRLRKAITGTDLLTNLRSERKDAFETLRLDERKALAHERRRHVEARFRPMLVKYERKGVKRLLADAVADDIATLVFRFGEGDERRAHAAMAVIELADIVQDKFADENHLSVLHDWVPLIDLAIAWAKDSKAGGNLDVRKTFLVADEETNTVLFDLRVGMLTAVLTNMAKVLVKEIEKWGIIGIAGDGTVENTGYIHPKRKTGRRFDREHPFTIDGITWQVLEVVSKFRFHPAAFPLNSGVSNPGSPAGSRLYIGDSKNPVGANRPHILLMRVRMNDSVEPIDVYADTHEQLLNDLVWAAHMKATIAQLQDLNDALEFGATVVLDLAEFIPVAGQAVAAARITKAVGELASKDLPDMFDALISSPDVIMKEVVTKLEEKLSLTNLLNYLIFSNDSSIGLSISKKPKRMKGGGRGRRWRRLARKLQSLVGGVARIFSRTHDGVQDRRQSIEHSVQSSRHASFVIAFIADHYHEILGLTGRLADSASLLPGDVNDFESARKQLDPKDLEGKFNELIAKMGTVELPDDILPLQEIIHALIETVGHRLGGKYKLGIRILLMLLDAVGATEKVTGMLADAIKGAFKRIVGKNITSMSDSILPVWKKTIVPNIEFYLGKAQGAVAKAVTGMFDAFGMDLDLKTAKQKTTFTGSDFPEAGPNEGREAQPSLESNLREGFSGQTAGASLNAAQVGDLIEKMPGEGGKPLASGVRADVELRFGQDFSDVRLHGSSSVDDALKGIGANALTSGSHILMKDGMAGSSNSREVLFHELAHVVQQTGVRPLGRKRNRSPQSGRRGKGIRFDPHAEAEADAAAAAALRGDARSIPLTKNAGGAQPSVMTLFGIRFLRQLTDIGALEAEVADIDKSKTGNKGKLIGRDVRSAVSNVGKRLKTIFGSPSPSSGLTIHRSMKKKYPQRKFELIKKQLQNSQTDIFNGVEDIAIRASFVAKRGKKGKPPTMGLDVDDFTRRLERYILGKTGILLNLDANKTGAGKKKRFKSKSKPYKSAQVKFIFLPAIHGNNKLWTELLEAKLGKSKEATEQGGLLRRNLRAVLRDLGTSISVWDDDYRLNDKVYEAAGEFEKRKGFNRLDASSLQPKQEYLHSTAPEITRGGNGNIRLHLGMYSEKNSKQKGRERESHHITQYLLLQYFHNGSEENEETNVDKKGFPLAKDHADAYPGLEVISSKPIKFAGAKTIRISELDAGRGAKMPTILLAAPTHRKGNLHINPKADEFADVTLSSQGAALNHIYTGLLPPQIIKTEREVASGKKNFSAWKAIIRKRGKSRVKTEIHDAMQGTYKYMRDYMQGQLKTGLITTERDYYNDLYATAHPNERVKRPMTVKDMEGVFKNAVKHNREGLGKHKGKGMEKYGWIGK